MRKNTARLFLFSSLLSISGMAENRKDSTQVGRNYVIDEVVVTGTRNETDIRHLPMTISIVNRQQIEKRYEPSLLPLLTEQVPGLFTTSRGIMGYGVSTGAAGGMLKLFRNWISRGIQRLCWQYSLKCCVNVPIP